METKKGTKKPANTAVDSKAELKILEGKTEEMERQLNEMRRVHNPPNARRRNLLILKVEEPFIQESRNKRSGLQGSK